MQVTSSGFSLILLGTIFFLPV